MWTCVTDAAGKPTWVPKTPDLSECVSPWVETLSVQLHNDEPITNIVLEMSSILATNDLIGGDLISSAKVMSDALNKAVVQLDKEPVDEQVHSWNKLTEVSNNTHYLYQVPPNNVMFNNSR